MIAQTSGDKPVCRDARSRAGVYLGRAGASEGAGTPPGRGSGCDLLGFIWTSEGPAVLTTISLRQTLPLILGPAQSEGVKGPAAGPGPPG